MPLLQIISDINSIAAEIKDAYKNLPITLVNDHVIRMSVMTEAFYWHFHPNSEKVFLLLKAFFALISTIKP